MSSARPFRLPNILLIAGILALAAALRLWRIGVLPPGFHFDESFEGLEAWRILTDPGYRPIFLAGNFGVPPLNAYANAAMFWLFGAFGAEAGPTAMRVTAAVFGVLGVLSVYALAAELRRFDASLPHNLPWLAATSLAVMRWHIHFSRIGIEPVIVPMLWAASLGLLVRGCRTGSLVSFAGAAIALAACMYTYQAAWIIPPLAAVFVGWLALRRRSELKLRWSGLAVAAGVALALVLPLAWFFGRNPDLLLLRPGQIAVVGSGAGQTSGTWANLWAMVRMFAPIVGVGDLDPRRNLPGAPALNLWQAIPFFVGLGVVLWRARRPAYGLLILSLAGLLLPGVISEYAPHFHRVLGAAAPAALLCGLGLSQMGAWVSKFGRARRAEITAAALPVLLLVLAAIVGGRDYFVRWARLPDLFYAFDAGLWQTGQWIAGQPAGASIWLTPRSADHPTLAFAQTLRSRPAPTSFDGRSIFPFTATSHPQPESYVVIEHEDFRTRLLLPEVFPDAQIAWEIADAGAQTYARVYTRPPDARPQRPPQHAFPARIGDGIRLAGYDVNPARLQPGGVLYLQLHWLVEATPGGSWTVGVHLLGPAKADGNRQWAGFDSLPGNGSLTTDRWQPDWRVLDEYQVPLPADLPPGDYALEIVLYQSDGQRLPADVPGLTLGNVRIEPAS